MKLLRLGILVGLLVCGAGSVAARQDDLGKQLSKVAGQNAVGYVSPLLSAWGEDLNSGIYHSADLHDVLGFDVGLKVGSVVVKDADRMFDFVLPDQIVYDGPLGRTTLYADKDYDRVITGAPTALGAETGIPVKVKATSAITPLRGQTIFTTPRGFGFNYVTMYMPQAAVGLPFGLEVVGRFVPTITLPGSTAKVNFIGFGIRHSIDQYIPMCPIDIAIHFMTQKLTLNDLNDNKLIGASGLAYGIEVSKSLALMTVYGGYQLEKSTWDIQSYDYADPTLAKTVSIPGFSVKGENTSRFHAGLRFLLVLVNVHADYSIAKQPVITLGLGVSFR